jgi:signal transduction histidine kinase
VTAVWLVDDTPSEARAARSFLASAHDVVLFEDGASLLERVSHGALPDVFVIDWVMPGMSGIEVARYLTADSHSSMVPILMLTGNRTTEDLVEGLEAGASDFVVKPYAPAELLARVGSLVRAKLLRERAEDAERAGAELAREQARLAELYLAVVGHDLRTPLAAISQIGRLLARESMSAADRTRLAERLASSSARMSALIDRVLDVTRVRLGSGLSLELTACSLRDICQQVVQELTLAHPQRALRIEGDGRGEGRWDRGRIFQVFSNLVANALQHGAPASPVTVRVRDAGLTTTVEVHNEGPPIAPDRIAAMFDPFRQGAAAKSGGHGLGLGLYIADQVVRAHRGSIGVTSGSGTTFTVTLPLPSPAT